MMPWARAWTLAVACLLAVGLPLRVRLDAPRIGHPLSSAPGAQPRLEAVSSLPWVLPTATRDAWAAMPGARLSWHLNRATLTLPEVPAKPQPASFRMVFVADLAPPDQAPLLEQFIREMEALHPDAVLVGGDLAYSETEAWYATVAAQFQRLERQGIPVIVAPGNHERKGWPLYLRHFGHTSTFRVEVGPFAILTLDSAHGRDQLTPSQFAWVKENLDQLEGRVPIVQIHHPLFPAGLAKNGEAGGSGGYLRGFDQAVVRLFEARGVPVVLSGHWHSDAVFDATGRLRDDAVDFPGPKFIVNTALGTELRRVTRWPYNYHGYRILEFQSGRLVRYTHDLTTKGVADPIASTPLGKPVAVPGGRP